MKTNKKVTIVQIAELSGVSVSTVSRVLNHKSKVDAETRARVERVIQEQDYTPNKLAQGLVKQRSKTIALIIPDISNPFFADIIHGVEDVCTPLGYSMYLCNSNFNHDQEGHFLTEMAERQVDGAIIISAFLQNQPLIRQLNRSSMCVVCIQTQIEGIDCVNTDDYVGMQQSIQKLIDLGHRRIGFVCIDKRGCRARYAAYCDTLAKHGIQLNPQYVKEHLENTHVTNPGYSMAKELLALPQPPTAIQTLNDHLAYGVYGAAQDAGLSIPQDLSVVGYDDLALSALLMPPLTTVHQPAYSMGEAGCELLMRNIASKRASDDRERREILFGTRYVQRASVAPPKA